MEKIEEIQAQEQGVKDTQDTQVVEKENAVPISRLNEVIREQNELRASMAKSRQSEEQARAKKLEKEGEYQTLLSEERNKNAKLEEQFNSTSQELNSYVTDEKARLLEKLPEEKRDKYVDVDLTTLRNLAEDLGVASKANLKQENAGLQRKNLPENPFKEMDKNEQRKNWGDIINSYKK